MERGAKAARRVSPEAIADLDEEHGVCLTCRFSAPVQGDYERGQSVDLECHRYPRECLFAGGDSVWHELPMVSAFDWCGEYMRECDC